MTARAVAAVLAAALLTTAGAGAVAAEDVDTDGTPAFERSILTTTQGEVVDVPVNLTGADTDSVRALIGDESDANFQAEATVTDADGDGRVTLRFDTATAGNGDPDSYLSVSAGDAMNDTTEVSGVDDRPLDAAAYDLSLGSHDDPIDVATLSLQSADGDETPSNDDQDTPESGHDGTHFVYEGEEISLESAARQRISGETTLEPGTTITVRVRSADSDAPFLMSVDANVSEYGTFNATVDLSNVPENTAFQVRAHQGGRTLAHAPGRVVACAADCDETPESGGEVDISSVVRVEQGGVARIPLDFGDAETLTVTVGDGDAGQFTATVEDRDGDGHATLLLRTDPDDGPRLLVNEGANRTVTVAGDLASEPLRVGEYPVDVYRGSDATGTPAVIATLSVTEDGTAGTADPAPGANDTPKAATIDADTGPSDSLLSGVGALALGAVLAVGGIALALGFLRS